MKDNAMNGFDYDNEAAKMTPEELDQALESQEQQSIRNLVKKLSDDSPSMVWRSKLNERLMLEAARAKRARRAIWIWRPALGLGLASCLEVAFFFQQGNQPAVAPAAPSGVEAALVNTHVDDVVASDVAGEGLSPIEAAEDSKTDNKVLNKVGDDSSGS